MDYLLFLKGEKTSISGEVQYPLLTQPRDDKDIVSQLNKSLQLEEACLAQSDPDSTWLLTTVETSGKFMNLPLRRVFRNTKV